MKVVFESYWLYFATRIYKATALYKNCRKLVDRKHLVEYVKKTISEPLDFKVFGGGWIQIPVQTRDPGARFQAPLLPPPPPLQLTTGAAVPVNSVNSVLTDLFFLKIFAIDVWISASISLISIKLGSVDEFSVISVFSSSSLAAMLLRLASLSSSSTSKEPCSPRLFLRPFLVIGDYQAILI